MGGLWETIVRRLMGKVKTAAAKRKGKKKQKNWERGTQHFHGDKLRRRSANEGALFPERSDQWEAEWVCRLA